MKRSIRPLLLAIAATIGVSSALAAPTLTAIPPLSGGNYAASSAVGQITPDGQFVVGSSGGAGWLWQLGTPSAINVLSTDLMQSQTANGVGYRTAPGGQVELVVRGLATSGHVGEWMSTDSGATFVRRRDTAYTRNTMSGYNQLGSMLGSDVYYAVSRPSGTDQAPDITRASGAWAPAVTYTIKNTTEASRMNAVSATGRAVGRRLVSSIGQNYTMYYTGTTPAANYFAGLDGSTRGEAYGVSQDGKVVIGGSPLVAGDAANVLYPYKAVFSAWNNNTLSSITALPLLAGSHPSTTKAVPFGASADGRWIVGYDYVGANRAVLWDTGDVNPANWAVYDLTTYAQANGILDGFSVLRNAFSVGVDSFGNPVIAGDGLYGGVSRAYAMVFVVPEPSTMSLLAIGIFGFLAARRRK